MSESSARNASSGRLSLRRKRSARIAAVQALYNRDITGTKLAPEAQADQLLGQWQDSIRTKDEEWPSQDMPERALLVDILAGAVAHQDAIEFCIASYIKDNWKAERMDTTLMAILRAAAYELRYKQDRNAAVIVDEYASIASSFLDETSLAFAHSVLKRIAENRTAPDA